VTTATLAMTQMANAAPAPPNVPDILKPPAGNQPFLVGHATGVQIYTCNGAGSWGTSVPRADLVGNNDTNVIVKHSAGPTWTATDGSTATKDPAVANKSAPGAAGAIPWLLLTTNAAAGPNGDRLANTTFIQRVNTVGGVAPTDVCDASTTPKVREMPYTADYYFWKATGNPTSKPVA
jgi:uncharacterized protein DUF3455